MPRIPEGYWCERSKRYYARLGPPSPKTGKSGAVMLKYPDGRPIAYGDLGAKAAAIQRLLAAREEARRRAAGPTVSDLIAGYLDWHERRGSKPRTIETHEEHLYKFEAFEWSGASYGARGAATIGVKDWTRYRKAMEARGCQTGYVKLAFASVAACWNWAARPVEDREPERLLASNPFAGLERPKRGRTRRPILPWPTIKALLDFAAGWVEEASYERDLARNRLKLLALRLIAESGCRPGEAVGLRWEWVHEEERVIIIPAGEDKTGWKTHVDRFIGLSPELAAELARVRASGVAHEVFVVAPRGEPRTKPPGVRQYDHWFRLLRRAAQGKEIPIPGEVTPYALRHAMVTQARAGGIDLERLAPAMGHGVDVARDTYARSQAPEVVAIMDRARAAREG
jgi:integrase